ncbi:nuclear transport factor 2 family protein [Nonomuraea rubra]
MAELIDSQRALLSATWDTARSNAAKKAVPGSPDAGAASSSTSRSSRSLTTAARNRLENVVLHETTDPEVVIAEYDLHGHVLSSGQPFASTYVMVMRIRDGLIVHSRDYADPRRTAGYQDELAAS